jgi:phage shock protein A
MSLMERVSALIRANLNDLVDKAEDPEKMIKQVILDMENQLMQVKTQVAIAVADEHLLIRKQKENDEKIAEWMRKAELAVDKNEDDLARAALERTEMLRRMGAALAEQVSDQRSQADTLKSAMRTLDAKLAEARHRSEMMVAQHRRSRAVKRAAEAQLAITGDKQAATVERMRGKIQREEASAAASVYMAETSLDDRFESLERDDRIERLLTELKARRQIAS